MYNSFFIKYVLSYYSIYVYNIYDFVIFLKSLVLIFL